MDESVNIGYPAAGLYVSYFTYTTAQISSSRFSGDNPNPVYFMLPSETIQVEPKVFIIIDGEAKVLRDENPPDAKPSEPESGVFRLINLAM
jgi:hypothetical protein